MRMARNIPEALGPIGHTGKSQRIPNPIRSRVVSLERWSLGVLQRPQPDAQGFDGFPEATERLRTTEASDVTDQPGYRFWFIVRDNRSVAALEMTGFAWTLDGHRHDILSSPSRSSHNRYHLLLHQFLY